MNLSLRSRSLLLTTLWLPLWLLFTVSACHCQGVGKSQEGENQNLLTRAQFSCGKTLDFGFVAKGSSKILSCIITNIGAYDLTLKGVSYYGAKKGESSFPGLLHSRSQ